MSVSHPRPTKAAEYRQEAERIQTMARQLKLNEFRDQLFDDAKRLETLAKQEERRAPEAALDQAARPREE